jgi:hypothetical protein
MEDRRSVGPRSPRKLAATFGAFACRSLAIERRAAWALGR